MLLYQDLSDRLPGTGFEVHIEYCPGLAESAYGTAMAIELDLPGISYERQKIHELTHKGYPGGKYIADLIVDDKIIPELKAVEELSSLMDSQIIHYLKFSGVQVGCLTNFKAERIRWKRFNTRRE